VSNMRRSKRLVALAASLSLIALAACGDDDDGGSSATTAAAGTGESATTTAAGGEETTTTESSEATETTEGSETTGASGAAPSGDVAMTMTIEISPDAVWEDKTPITWEDLQCTWQAALNTPGSVLTSGFDQIVSVEKGKDDKEVIVSLSTEYGPYKTLFGPASAPIIKKAAVDDCMDISGDFSTELPFSGRNVILQSWSEGQSTFVPNPNYWGDDKMTVDQIVFVPQTDQDTELASIKAGQVDYIYPQFGDALKAVIGDPNIKMDIKNGGDYEGIYFQQASGPLSDPVFRKALAFSIDRQALFDQIYGPIFEAAGTEGKLNNCGAIVEGPYCPPDNFQKTYDPAQAEKLLTDAGWAKNGEGLWAKDGQAPTLRWMVNAGNTRRESTQAYLIPLLKQAGFNVVADNCDADCVFQQRLPGLDYEMAMYINTAPPDPQYLTTAYTCDQIPSDKNGQKGGNTTGWCDEAATKALHDADSEPDAKKRTDLIFSALKRMDETNAMLPLVTFPKTGVWRTDQVGGAVDKETANFDGFRNFPTWEDKNGDGKIVIGAEQWPSCLNPYTECANSSWYVWTASFPTMPGVWDTTADGKFVPSNLVTGEPVIKVL
jgi:peptide/nickel transport system substrate-binding protein